MRMVKGSASLLLVAAATLMFLTGCETTKHAEIMSAEELAARGQEAEGVEVAQVAEEAGIPLGEQGVSEGALEVGKLGGPSAGVPPVAALSPEAPPVPTLREASQPAPLAEEPAKETMSVGRGEEVVMGEAPLREGGEAVQPSKSDITAAITEYPKGLRSPPSFFGPERPPQPYLHEREVTPSAEAEVVPSVETPASEESIPSPGEAGPTGYEGEQFVQALKPSDIMPEAPPQPFLGEAHAPESTFVQPSLKPVPTPKVEPVPTPREEERVAMRPTEEKVAEPMKPLVPGDIGEGEAKEAGAGAQLGHVYFDFDKFYIRDDAVPTLRANAQLLKTTYEGSNVLIEGHCDERGTSEYNLVLGERRAQAVKNYLIDLGISPSRIQIVSYGKERPFCTVSEEWCWQKNRQGHFVLQ